MFDHMQKLVKDTVRKTFSKKDSNFVSIKLLPDLTVTRGDNIRSTCYQYAVQDDWGCKVMVVKFYDKTVDLICREATHPVGSRIATIMGQTGHKDVFKDRIRDCLRTGMTRVEVSVCPAAFNMY